VAGPADHSRDLGGGEYESVLAFGIWARLRLSMVDRTNQQRCGTRGQSRDGTFYAAGIGGQLAFVIPAHDLIVVHRGPHVEGGLANLRTVGRLLWLILDAGKFPDIGPDASLDAAQGMRVWRYALANAGRKDASLW
jgi:fermentation-respiration switch protein FrsA (DUF1100 family)